MFFNTLTMPVDRVLELCYIGDDGRPSTVDGTMTCNCTV
jgi:hypothetical protein